MPRPETSVRLSDEVSSALAEGHPVVALESTIFSRMGLPAPHNQSALAACLDSVRSGGAVPAITAVVDGEARVGLDPDEHGRILEADTKTSRRDLGVAIGARWPVGATTVAASLRLAALAGISVFATGGIGGAHRGWAETGDVSADLGALASEPVVCVSAGAKAFLDLGATLERLDTLGVPVLGWRTDAFQPSTPATRAIRCPTGWTTSTNWPPSWGPHGRWATPAACWSPTRSPPRPRFPSVRFGPISTRRSARPAGWA